MKIEEIEVENKIELYFEIHKGKVVCSEFSRRIEEGGEEAMHVVSSLSEIYAVAEKIAKARGWEYARLEYWFSSSIDFAEEYSSEPSVLKFCKELRG